MRLTEILQGKLRCLKDNVAQISCIIYVINEKCCSLRVSEMTSISPAQWVVELEAESTLHNLGTRGDIIKTMHRAFRAEYLNHSPQILLLNNSRKSLSLGVRLIKIFMMS